jgi:multicomponent K+:H+ antiporter subunit D
MNHLVILPILIPLLGAALSLFVEHRRYGPVQRAVAWTALSALALAVGLLFGAHRGGDINVYLSATGRRGWASRWQ